MLPRRIGSSLGLLLLVGALTACGLNGPDNTPGSSGPAMTSRLTKDCATADFGEPGQEASRGAEGSTVPPGPVSALLCREEHEVVTERVVRSEPELKELVDSLNSIKLPKHPLEGEIAGCPEENRSATSWASDMKGPPKCGSAPARTVVRISGTSRKRRSTPLAVKSKKPWTGCSNARRSDPGPDVRRDQPGR
jgi:predicted small lipoprotein YifL